MATNILDPRTRQNIIIDIEDTEERKRREYHQKAQEMFQDEIRLHLVNFLAQEFKSETIAEMRLTDLNVVKKVVNRLSAPIYKRQPRREAPEQEALDLLLERIKFQQKMSRLVKFWRLHKNTMLYTRPLFNDLEGGTVIECTPLGPHQYSIKPNKMERELADVVILSRLHDRDRPELRQKDISTTKVRFPGDMLEEKIDTRALDDDAEFRREFIFWSMANTMLTFSSGKIIIPDESGQFLNPIGRLPFSNLADMRDGEFWSIGGADLINATITVNLILSDAVSIAKLHGYKMLFMSGSSRALPNIETIGPTKAIRMTYELEDPKPEIGFVGGEANVSQHVQAAMDYLNLILSTNGLKAGTVEGDASASGVAKMMDEAELTESIDDAVSTVRDTELDAIKVAVLWHNHLAQNVSDYVWKDIPLINPDEISVTFPTTVAPVFSASDIQAKKAQLEMGVTSKRRVIRDLNPGITDKEIDDLLLEIAEEKQANMERMQTMIGGPNAETHASGEEEEQTSDGEEERKEVTTIPKEEEKEE